MAKPRRIAGFHEDDEGHWVADLECGHPQHVRHQPPFQNRPWVATPEGRASKLGVELDCNYCDMPELPAGVAEYSRTRTFNEHSVPAALVANHTTKPGVWGRLVVEAGKVLYTLQADEVRSFVLRPGIDGIIPPEVPHRVRPLESSAFHVEFLRSADGRPSNN